MMVAAPDHAPLPVGAAPALDRQRLMRAMERWRRRSQVIHFWRRALPVLMGLIAASVLITVGVRTLFSVSRPAEQDQQIRMLSPKFFGRDQGGRPFTVIAQEAVRDSAHVERVTLTQPDMVLKSLDNTPPTSLHAATGLYNETTHILSLDGHVRLDDGKGDVFVSEHAL